MHAEVHGAPPLDVKKAKLGYGGNSDMKTLFCRNLEYSATEEDLRNIRFFSNWRGSLKKLKKRPV